MTYRMTMSLLMAASLGIVGACTAEHHEDSSSQNQTDIEAAQSQAPSGATATGTVVETINAANYTYVRVDTGDEEIWAAATRFEVAVGEVVVVPLEMPMQDFHSESLDRTFEVVYFTSQILPEGAAAAAGMPPGHPEVTGAMASSHDSATAIELIEPVEPVKGGVTVARVWTDTAELDGSQITVRGRVVKYNGGILGTNWIHIQDGTGSAEDGTHDITVTTDATASVGDVITVQGTLVTDKDFGAGYTYVAMIEDATIVSE
jgi:uncharacterized protein (UPF0212 family)